MSSKKIPGGLSLTTEMWQEVDKQAKLLGYSRNQFVEECVEAILKLINTTGRRTVPRIVHIADAVRDSLNIPIHLEDNLRKQKKEVKDVEGNLVSDGDEEGVAA
jgi:hypothetical protein